MKPLKKSLFTLTLVLSIYATAQNSKITIGKSTSNSLEKAKPAQLIATFPKNDTLSNSWLVDGFIEYSRSDIISTMDIGAFIELHKNTLLSKEQDVRQFGLNLKRIFAVEGDNSIWFNTTLNLKHSNNRITREKAFQGILATTIQLISSKNHKIRFLRAQTSLINEESNLSDYFNMSHNNSFGFGYIGGNEDILLFNGSFELNLYPLSTLFYKKKKKKLTEELKISGVNDTTLVQNAKIAIEREARRFANIFVLKGELKGRELISGKTNTDLNTFIKLSGGINYSFTEESAIGIMYGWQKGADPYSGLNNQTFSSITATLKLSI